MVFTKNRPLCTEIFRGLVLDMNMDGRILLHTVVVALVLFVIASDGADERATFCLTKSEKLVPSITCSKTCAPTILIKDTKSQIMTDCNATSSPNPWKLNDTASHMVWNNCNLRGPSCLPITYHDDSAVRLEVFYTCVNLPSLHRQDLCSNVGFVIPTPFYLHTPSYPNFHTTTTTQTNCTCRLRTASGSDVTLTVLDMLTSLPESLTVEWNGGREDITTVSDEVGYVAAKRSVTKNDVKVIFKPKFPGPGSRAYMWIRVETQAAASPETVLLTCNGNLGTTPTISPTISPSLCPTTTTITTTTTTTTASTTTKLPTTTTATAPNPTTNQTTTGPSQETGTGSGFSIYYLVPVVVIVITIIILAVVLAKRTRRERFEDITPKRTPIVLTSIEVDGNFYLTSGRPKFILETPGGRVADNTPYKAIELSPKELDYFDPPKNTDTLNCRASLGGSEPS